MVHRCNPTRRAHAPDRLLRPGLSGARFELFCSYAPSAVSVGPGSRPVAATAASSPVRDLRRSYHASGATRTRHQSLRPLHQPSVLEQPATALSARYRARGRGSNRRVRSFTSVPLRAACPPVPRARCAAHRRLGDSSLPAETAEAPAHTATTILSIGPLASKQRRASSISPIRNIFGIDRLRSPNARRERSSPRVPPA